MKCCNFFQKYIWEQFDVGRSVLIGFGVTVAINFSQLGSAENGNSRSKKEKTLLFV